VCALVSHNLIMHMRSHVRSINTDVLGEFMLHKIPSNTKRVSTMRGKRIWCRRHHSKILKEPLEPGELSCHSYHSPQHSLNTWTRNCSLLLGFPGTQGGPKENTIRGKRMTTRVITSVGRIRIRLKLKGDGARKEQATWDGTTKLAENTKKVSIVELCGSRN